MKRLKLVVLASGEGTNVQAVLDAVREGSLAAEVLAVVCNRRHAGVLARAEREEVSTVYVPLKPYRDSGRSREEYDADLAELVAQFDADWVVCLGWMHILTAGFLDRFGDRVINLHPALPGAFPGSDALARGWRAAAEGSDEPLGCMVHVVVPEIDAGPVLATAPVPYADDEPFEAYRARFQEAEHDLVLRVLRALAAGNDTLH